MRMYSYSLLLAHFLQHLDHHNGLREQQHLVFLDEPGFQNLLQCLKFPAAHNLAVVSRH